MMSQPGQKPRGGGIYRSPFHYTSKDVACEYCQNYVRKHPCRLCECTCLDERIEAGVLEVNEFVRDCFAPSMGPQFQKRVHQQLRGRNPQFFLSDAHRRRWTHWRERCWRLSERNKAALFLLTAYESLWRRMVWKCGNNGFDFQNVRLRGIEPELACVSCLMVRRCARYLRAAALPTEWQMSVHRNGSPPRTRSTASSEP